MFHQQPWLARMEEYRSPLQLCSCSQKYSPTPLQGSCEMGLCLLYGPEAIAKKSRGSHPLAAPRCQPAALCPLAGARSTVSAVPNITSCHTWFPHGAHIKYPIHYVHSIPGGDWNKKLFWQKSLGNETQERWGERRRKIEIKTRKKHSTRWMEWVQNYLQLQSWKKKMNTWAYCEIKSVFRMCVPKRASHRSEPWAEKRNSLFPQRWNLSI